MADKKGNVASRARELTEPIIQSLGYRVWNVTFGKEVTEYNLEIEIDKDGGIDIDDCQTVTDAINPVIDELNPLETSYNLIVSSAGLDRELTADTHYDFAIAGTYPVTAKLFKALDGSKEYVGTLSHYDGEAIFIICNEKEIKIDRKLISRLTAWCG